MESETTNPARLAGSPKGKFSVILVLRTMFHGFNCVLFSVVGMWGIVMCYTIDATQAMDPILSDLKYLAPFFLTNWNFAFQTLFLTLSLANDVLEWFDKHENHLAERLRYWRDVIFSGLVVPFTLFVSSMFWCVYAVDRELVFPKAYDNVVPWWFNHCVHTNISVVVLVETLLQARRRPRDFKKEISLVIIVDIAYAIVYYGIYAWTGRWLYQIFGIMNWWQVCLYQLLIWLSSFVFYYVQFPINRLVHGEAEEADAADGRGQLAEEVLTKEGPLEADKAPLPPKSWSLKYRTGRGQFENSHL